MADYHTEFCIELDRLGDRELSFWHSCCDTSHEDSDGEECWCFNVTVDGTSVFLEDDCGHVVIDHVAAELRRYLKTCKLPGPIVVTYANTASKHVPDSFDGGVVVVWPTKEVYLNTSSAGRDIAQGLAPEVSVYDYATALEELDDAAKQP
jgi:hypothetical protein